MARLKDIFSGIGIIVFFIAALTVILVVFAAIAPATLIIAGISYRSIGSLVLFAAAVIGIAELFEAVIGALCTVVFNSPDGLNENSIWYMIFETFTLLITAEFMDYVMDSVQLSTISSLIFAVGFALVMKILNIIVDNTDDEDTEKI